VSTVVIIPENEWLRITITSAIPVDIVAALRYEQIWLAKNVTQTLVLELALQ
jgi:hypothetical protein